MSLRPLLFALCASLFCSQVALASPARDLSGRALAEMSIEELANLEVTSVSKTRQNLANAAAAVAVVTGEDIRRSGATTIPEALRHVPGLHVARQNANAWAVSARGFSSVNSEKLLVLSDTRSIYTPLFSGVFWDVQDYLLEDIERVEIIRGPGAALWGSNAVNGVINITSKSARDTQGLYLEAGVGTEERATAAVRYGGRSDSGIYYRVFGKYFDRGDTDNPSAQSSDDWRSGHFGFRADWDASAVDAVTVQGDIYRGSVGRLVPAVEVIGRAGPGGNLETEVRGGNVLGRWRRALAGDADVQLRAYYDRTERDDPSYDDDLDTVDIDLQHRFQLAPRQEILWGLNYRHTSNRNRGKGVFAVAPASSNDELVSVFVQDQIQLLDTLQVTVGSKFEHNDFSGFEAQPSIRAAWDFAPAHTLWAAVSRAARVPTRFERDIAIDVTDPAGNPIIRLLGNDEYDAERLVAYEAGYRWQALTNLAFDLAVFNNRYKKLAALELGELFIDPADGRTVIPVINRNVNEGDTRGAELLVTYKPLPYWRLSANYAYLDMHIDAGGDDLNRGKFLEDATPRHQFGLRSSMDLPRGFQLDLQYRYISAVGKLPESVVGEGVPSYSELDVRLARSFGERLEISLVGQNLLDAQHPEFGVAAKRGEIERGVYGKVVWEF